MHRAFPSPVPWVLALVTLTLTACAAHDPAGGRTTPGPPVCFDCFWEHQPPGLREEVLGVYGERRYEDPMAEAERRLLLGRIRGDAPLVCEAFRIFAEAVESDPSRKLLAVESAAFLAAGCGEDPAAWFRRAARVAGEAGDRFKARTYRALASGTFRPRIGEQGIGRALEPPGGAGGFLLGSSRIFVPEGTRVTMQAERTVRDWLSYQLRDDLSSRPANRDAVLDWHEGARLRDLMAATAVEAHSARGTLVVRDGDRWLAPDEAGVFRFEILGDKVQYPSTRVFGRVALLLDTHGVAAVLRESSRTGAGLVLACGDDPSKMRAAYRLASAGISVWFPCDRFVGDVLGHDGSGVLVGSAPVRSADGGAVIGDTPVAFRFDETIVIEDSNARGASQYYDGAARYFRRLSRIVPLRLEYRTVDGPGQASRIVERARATGATAIALRVATPEDAEPVRAWLAESPDRRSVLFHSAPYPSGIALFRDFPGQTTFGDPRPVWIP